LQYAIGAVRVHQDGINRLIEWKAIEKKPAKRYKKAAGADGRPAYPALPVFKLMLGTG